MGSNIASSNGLSLLQAARATGKTKVAILKAIQRGAISATKDDNGAWHIRPEVLFNYYKPLPVSDNSSLKEPITNNAELAPIANADIMTRLAVMEAELRLTKERLDDVLKQRDSWQSQAQQLLLTDNRQKSLWQRLLGK